MPLPAWDPASVEGGDPYVVRGKRHGNYCGWGHTSPPSTAPVDAVDAICRRHDMAYVDGTTREQRCAADTYAREQLEEWLNTWTAAPPRMREKATAMRRALYAAELAGGCIGLLGGETPSDRRPAYEPHPDELGEVYDPRAFEEPPPPPASEPFSRNAAGGMTSGAGVRPGGFSPACWDALEDRCEDADARSELETLETAEAFMAGV